MALSSAQTRFFEWLKRDMPYLLPLFDLDSACYREDAVDRYLGAASHGEAIMARFALGVWCNNNRFGFDVFEAAGTLDAEQMTVVTSWMRNPLWP
ncbi:hypothetical protein [Alcanivorax sp. 1008]|uniref:hypothetical protein n=1 Tax=Alcanivorax sp. 1008 TaxID=2816853 RepID=UPI001E18F947|nr:hypothetical protein [Alcanivorax sp. 1008]MCC1496884.1 hypothetical protein [Alcanivorax sp. 1008]